VFDNLKCVTACKLRVRSVSLVICRGSIPKESKEVRLSYKNIKVKFMPFLKNQADSNPIGDNTLKYVIMTSPLSLSLNNQGYIC